MKYIQLCYIDPSNRAEGRFTVTVHSDDQQQQATFDCDSERDAIVLRNAIREHASKLRRVADFSHADRMERALASAKDKERLK